MAFGIIPTKNCVFLPEQSLVGPALKYLIPILLFSCMALNAQAQQPVRVIQFTGVVMEQDSMNVIPGVHVYVPKTGRGTTSNPYGFFSLPVVEGDSVVFTAVGFKRTSFVIPEHKSESSLKVIVTLQNDVTFLDEVEIFPFPSEETFKRAVVTMRLPYNRENANLQAWLNATYMKENPYLMYSSPAMNQRYFQDQQLQQFQNKFGMPQNNLLNPWAWSSFINSLRGN